MAITQVNLRLNTAALSASKLKVMRLFPQCHAHLANKTLHFIARHAHANMPVVTPARISEEMESVRFLTRRGDSRVTRRTRAESIVLSSFYPNSEFNRRTGGVFKRVKPVFSGDTPTRRSKFWQWVSERAVNMTKARRKSSGFYKFGAAVVKFIFNKNFAPVRMPPSDGGTDSGDATAGSGPVSKAIGRVAGGRRANSTAGPARASFWVSTTEPDSKGSQEGINRVLQPAWQRAVDAEAANTFAYAEKLYAQALRESGYTVK